MKLQVTKKPVSAEEHHAFSDEHMERLYEKLFWNTTNSTILSLIRNLLR